VFVHFTLLYKISKTILARENTVQNSVPIFVLNTCQHFSNVTVMAIRLISLLPANVWHAVSQSWTREPEWGTDIDICSHLFPCAGMSMNCEKVGDRRKGFNLWCTREMAPNSKEKVKKFSGKVEVTWLEYKVDDFWIKK
jgi:hypothetical protein